MTLDSTTIPSLPITVATNPAFAKVFAATAHLPCVATAPQHAVVGVQGQAVLESGSVTFMRLAFIVKEGPDTASVLRLSEALNKNHPLPRQAALAYAHLADGPFFLPPNTRPDTAHQASSGVMLKATRGGVLLYSLFALDTQWTQEAISAWMAANTFVFVPEPASAHQALAQRADTAWLLDKANAHIDVSARSFCRPAPTRAT